jgi:hypothetical protein
MIQYTTHHKHERQYVAKDSDGFLIIHPLRNADGNPVCLNLSIKPSERDKSKWVSKYSEMTVTLDGFVFCPILVNDRENNPKYHLQVVEYTQQQETTICSDRKFPDGIRLRLRNKRIDDPQPGIVKTNHKKIRQSKHHGQSSSSRDVKAYHFG